MAEQQRRLAAILFSDIAGYTAQMGSDERRAIAAVQRSRREQRALVEQYRGEWVQEVGDGALCTFPSAVDAVDCAREIQRVFARDPDVSLRIGIHEGDIVVEGEDVFGDGVNVAARLQALAPPGGICVSGKLFDEIRNKPGLDAEFLGERELKNVDQPVPVYALGSEALPAAAAAAGGSHRLRDRVLVAVAGAVALGAVIVGVDTDRREAMLASVVIELPQWVGHPIEQDLGFATASDGVRIAYATTGAGPPIVQVLGWMTHLERGLGSPTYDSEGFLERMSEDHFYVRYDGRGSGLSDRGSEDMSLDARVRDLETVVDALRLERFALYAISAGGPTAIRYAARHPERVTRIAFYASFGRVDLSDDVAEKYRAIVPLMRAGWGDETHAYRNVFTTLIDPNADGVGLRVMSEFLKIANDGPDAALMMESLLQSDSSLQAAELDLPVLVLHRRGDQLVPLAGGGRDLAALIPGARLEVLEGERHGDVDRELIGLVDEFFAGDLEGSGPI